MILPGHIVALGSVAALFVMAYAVRALGVRNRWSAETQRKLVHVGVGVHAITLPFVMDKTAFFGFAAMALAALLVLRLPWVSTKGPGASVHSVERQSWGDVLFLLAVTVLFVRSPGDPALYVLPLAVLTLSDAAAAVIGTEYGRLKFGSGDRRKSIEGTVVFFVVTWMVSVTILITATDIPRVNTVLLATVVSAFAALVEAESWKGLDNLFVPCGIHALLSFNGHAEPLLLALIASGFLGAIVIADACSKWTGMTSHAARSTAVCLFLTAGMTAPHHAIIPVAALAAHVASRRDAKNPDKDDLDFVAVLCVIGVFWLSAAGITGRPGTEFYTITFAGLFAGLTVLALPTRVLALRAVAALLISGGTWIAHHEIVDMNGTDLLWLGRTEAAVTAAVTILACAVGAAWRPVTPFRRGPLFTVAALAIPAIAYTAGHLDLLEHL